jgi:hypothetical protein
VAVVDLAAAAGPLTVVRAFPAAQADRPPATRRLISCAIDRPAVAGLRPCRRLGPAVAVVRAQAISQAVVDLADLGKTAVEFNSRAAVAIGRDDLDKTVVEFNSRVVVAIGRAVLVEVIDPVVAIDLAVVIDPVEVETIDPADRATVIDRADLAMATGPADPVTEIGPDVREIGRGDLVRVAAASSGRDQEIGPIIAPIAIRTGISGRIGATTSGPTSTTIGTTTGTTGIATSTTTGGTTVPTGGSTTTSTTGVGRRGRR